MKLANSFAATSKAMAPSGKRKKKQLLLEPQSPELRDANDGADKPEGNGVTNASADKFCLINKDEPKKKENVMLLAKDLNQKESTENLKTRHDDLLLDPRERFNSTKTTVELAYDNLRIYTTSVINQSQSHTGAGSRRKPSDHLRHYFDFNRMRQQQRYPALDESSAVSTLMMANREQRKDDHQQHQLETTATAAKSAANSSRRKSELTSFLTILFGSMLAVLLLASNRQIVCGQSVQPMTAGRNAISFATTMAAMSRPTSLRNATTDNVAQESSASLVNGTAMIESIAGTDATLDSSFVRGSTGGDNNLSSTVTTTPSNGNDDEDYEDASDSTKSAKTKLGDLLVDTARDSTDLLINHLQGDVEGESKSSDDLGEETGPDSDSHLASEDGARASTDTNNRNSTGAVPSPLAALPVLSRPDSVHFGAGASSGSNNNRSERMDEEAEQIKFAFETYAKWRAAGDDLIELFSRKLMPIIIEHGYDVDSETVAGFLQAFNGIRQLKPWALKLLDAWTKLSPGVLLGTQSDFGDFDECLNIRVDDPNGLAAENSEHFPGMNDLDPLTGLRSTTLVGRYCLADVEFPKPPRRRAANTSTSTSPTLPFEPIELRNPLLDFAKLPAYKDTIFVETANFFHMLYVDPIRVGICLTNKIDPQSFQQVFNKLLEEFRVTIDFRGRCVTKYDRPTWTSYQQVSAYVLVIACSLVALSTGLDLIHRKLNKLPCPRAWSSARLRLQMAALRHRDIYTSFSLIRNTKRLFKPSADSRPAQAQSSATDINLHHYHQATCPVAVLPGAGSVSCAGSSSAATSSSTAGSSVESSPSIERRSSADTTTSSMRDLISLQHSTTESAQRQTQRQFTKKGTGGVSSSCCCDKLLSKSDLKPPSQAVDNVSLLSLHGIRVITMVWMIVNHTYMFGGFFVLWAYRRLIDIAEWPKSLSFQMVLNGWLTVETYFFLSAMIIVLNVLPLMKARKFNYFIYILHRLLRLLPAYIGLICLNFLWPLISSGPVWLVKGKSFVQDPCEQYLWTNFLFINNWIWPEKQCMVHTWFLSADFQLYILAPIIVYLLYRRPALGHSLNLCVAILASTLSGFVIYANKLMPTTLINKLEFDAIKQQLSYSYFATYQHMGPYCLGLLVGYLLHKRPHARLPKHLTWLLWLLLPPLSFTTLLLTYLWNGAYPDADLINPSPLVSALYVAIHRTIWSALVAWLVFACATGRAKLLSSFLSSAIFLPISRLSYSIYLVHLPVILFRALNLRHTIEWTDQNILWEACGNFVVSLLLGFFLNVAFESPIINLENVIFSCWRSSAISPHNSKPVTCSNIYPSGKLMGLTLSTGPPDKLRHGGGEPAAATCSYSTSSNSSDGCEESVMGTGVAQHNSIRENEGPGLQARKSLRPKQSASVEQIFGRASATQSRSQIRGTDSEDRSVSKRQLQRQQQQAVDMLNDEGDHDDYDEFEHQQAGGTQTSVDSPCSDKTMAPMSSDTNQSVSPHQPDQVDQTAAGKQFATNNQDDLYSIAAEYRHYAPGGYQQWRRAIGSLEGHHHHSQLPPASSTSMRSMQYATLARANRLRQDQMANSELSQFARGPIDHQHHHQRRAAAVDYHLDRPYQQRFPAVFVSNYEDPISPHHDQLFPNSSELGFSHTLERGADARSTLIQQRQLLASRRLLGRYNTLTGTGSRDWRLQLQARHYGLHQEQMNDTDLLRSWKQQKQQTIWSPSSKLQLGAGAPPEASGGSSLLIPRIDWSNTLRRHARNGTAGAVGGVVSGGPSATGASGSLITRPEQLEDSKIVEEQMSGDAEETSVL